jgi:holo-[acyl-carrier protein] synthase
LIVGTGIDIVEIGRLRKALERWPRLYDRLFSPAEIASCPSLRTKFIRLAGRFAAKEAVAKAIGTPLSWRDVEITNDTRGKPMVTLGPRAAASTRGVEVLVSISHGRDYAVAHALAQADFAIVAPATTAEREKTPSGIKFRLGEQQ